MGWRKRWPVIEGSNIGKVSDHLGCGAKVGGQFGPAHGKYKRDGKERHLPF